MKMLNDENLSILLGFATGLQINKLLIEFKGTQM